MTVSGNKVSTVATGTVAITNGSGNVSIQTNAGKGTSGSAGKISVEVQSPGGSYSGVGQPDITYQ